MRTRKHLKELGRIEILSADYLVILAGMTLAAMLMAPMLWSMMHSPSRIEEHSALLGSFAPEKHAKEIGWMPAAGGSARGSRFMLAMMPFFLIAALAAAYLFIYRKRR